MEKMGQDWERNAPGVDSGPKQGLSWIMAASFIVGVVGNSALIILSTMILAGWGTLFLLILCGCNACYAAICLGRSWSILEERYGEYKNKNRRPYSEIGQRAVGEKMKYVVSVVMKVSLLGVSIVYLVLASSLIAAVAANSGLKVTYWILIVAVVLCPLMWLGTPKDFWPAAVLAAVCAVIEILLLIIAISTHNYNNRTSLVFPQSAYTFFSALGILYLIFGGIASFPAIQNDMKNKEEFPKAAIAGFSIALLSYLLLAIVGYTGGGDLLKMNVMVAFVVFLALHMLLAFLVTTNAVCQEFEENFEVPKEFGWKRVAVRVGVLVFIVLAAAVIPSFQDGMSVLTGTTLALTSSVFPCVLYYLLCQQQPSDQQWPVRIIPMHEKIYMVVVIVCGIVAGIMQTYSAFYFIINKPPTTINM